MDLEFLLRRSPPWREVAQGILFQAGDIVEHGEEAEAAGLRRRRLRAGRRPRGRLARDRQPEGSVRDEPPAALARADQRRRLEAARRRGARAPDPGARRAQARRLLRPARVGALGDEPRAHRRAERRPVRGRLRPAARACSRWSSCAPTSSSRARSCATPTAAPTTPTSRRSTAPRIGSRWPRTSPSSTAGRARSPGSPRPRRTSRCPLGDAADAYPRRSPAPSSGCSRSGIGGPYGLALGREQYRRVIETAEHGGYPLLDHLREILAGSDRLGARRRRRGRGEPARRRLRVRVRPGPLDRLRLTRRRARAALPRGELQLPRRDAGGRGRADALAACKSQDDPSIVVQGNSSSAWSSR